jgi:hypothetical protein
VELVDRVSRSGEIRDLRTNGHFSDKKIKASEVGGSKSKAVHLNEIFVSARMLSEMWSKNFEYWSEERTGKHIEQVRKYENIFWWSGSEDPIVKRVDDAVSKIEETTKAIIESKGTLFKILNWEIPSIFKRKRKNISS